MGWLCLHVSALPWVGGQKIALLSALSFSISQVDINKVRKRKISIPHSYLPFQTQKKHCYLATAKERKKGRETAETVNCVPLDIEMMPPGGSTKVENSTAIPPSSFPQSGAPHSSPPLLLPFLPTLFLAASGRGQDGRESKENRKGERQSHRDFSQGQRTTRHGAPPHPSPVLAPDVPDR